MGYNIFLYEILIFDEMSTYWVLETSKDQSCGKVHLWPSSQTAYAVIPIQGI